VANEVTVATAAEFIDQHWSPELNRAIEFKLVIANLFTDWSSRMPGSGNTLHQPTRHHLAVNDKAASIDATPEAITEVDQDFTADTHQIVAQDIESIAEVMSKYDIRNEYTMDAAYVLARAVEVKCAALLDDNTTQTVGVLTAELTDDNIIRGWQYLMDSSGEPPFKGVVSPACWGGLLKVEKFTNQLYNGDTGGKALHEAQIGKIYQATFYQSQLTVGTAPNSSGHLWAGDHFVKIWKKRPTQDAWFSPLSKSWIVATDQIYGVDEYLEADEAASATSTAALHGVRLQTLK
jgi:hypothetical protein